MKKIFRVRSIIKIPGKSFDDLSLDEVALMIDADSSISPDGNDFFDSSALDVFLHNAEISRDDLQEIRKRLLAGIYLSVPGSKIKEVDTNFLQRFSGELRSRMGEGASSFLSAPRSTGDSR